MQIIEKTSELELLCQRLSLCEFVTVDLEFIREKTYYPKLCLIQIASIKESAIIDPLAEDISLSSFFELMQNKKVKKVFHSCRQDIEIIFMLSKQIPYPIFDTQIMAMVCGFGDNVGYEKLVKQILGKTLDKTDRLSNWQNRPLDDSQLQYALGDVTHLIEIYEFLLKDITNKNRDCWIEEENQILYNEKTYAIDPLDAWHKLHHRSSNYKVLSNLKALAAWREVRARKKDLPRQNIIKDDLLIMIATSNPKNNDDLLKIRGIRKDIATGKLATEILETLSKVKYDKNIAKEIKQQNFEAIPSLVELLKLLLKLISQKEGVVARLIAQEKDILQLASYNDEDNALLTGWRYKIFGKEAIKLRNGEISIHYNPNNKNIEFLTHKK